ncbi:MAG: gamma-glutamyltransferase family protein [Chloroflexi bacterium]|nr:gamma-glutamyltransferase family protein [Chloroflexota bacterium]
MIYRYSFSSYRSPVLGRKGAVGSSQPLATAAGIEILSKGGTAADAAVAVAAALNVTEPGSTGLGGDAFALYYDAGEHKVFSLNGSGRAPKALTLERVRKEGFETELPPQHPYCITVPGACAMWCDLTKRFGRLPLSETLAPAIRLADEGFPVAPLTALAWQNAAKHWLSKALNGSELTIDGRGPAAGEIFRNPGLARTLRIITEGGKKAYYEGEIAESIVSIIREAGGCMELDDLAAHQSTWVEPISIEYRGLRIWECPPNGQGLAALLALNILEGFDIADLPANSTQRLHLTIEAMRLAFADAFHYIADPDFSPVPLQDLLSRSYADDRRRWINPNAANLSYPYGSPIPSSDTVYLSVADQYGNACSFINSNYMGFGTGIVPRGRGFSLQNRGHNFSLQEGHANQLMPGKRPYHTIIPAMATCSTDDSLYASYGVMGGFMQPQGHLQVTVAMLDDELDPQAALDRPRFCLQGQRSGGKVALEEGIPFEVLSELAAMGHPVIPVSGTARSVFGRGQIIRRDPENGVLWAGSDPRADGCAMTLV